jgi:hypothetical protein
MSLTRTQVWQMRKDELVTALTEKGIDFSPNLLKDEMRALLLREVPRQERAKKPQSIMCIYNRMTKGDLMLSMQKMQVPDFTGKDLKGTLLLKLRAFLAAKAMEEPKTLTRSQSEGVKRKEASESDVEMVGMRVGSHMVYSRPT